MDRKEQKYKCIQKKKKCVVTQKRPCGKKEYWGMDNTKVGIERGNLRAMRMKAQINTWKLNNIFWQSQMSFSIRRE